MSPEYIDQLASQVSQGTLQTPEAVHQMDRIDWLRFLEERYPGWAVWEHELVAVVLEKRHWIAWR